MQLDDNNQRIKKCHTTYQNRFAKLKDTFHRYIYSLRREDPRRFQCTEQQSRTVSLLQKTSKSQGKWYSDIDFELFDAVDDLHCTWAVARFSVALKLSAYRYDLLIDQA